MATSSGASSAQLPDVLGRGSCHPSATQAGRCPLSPRRRTRPEVCRRPGTRNQSRELSQLCRVPDSQPHVAWSWALNSQLPCPLAQCLNASCRKPLTPVPPHRISLEGPWLCHRAHPGHQAARMLLPEQGCLVGSRQENSSQWGAGQGQEEAPAQHSRALNYVLLRQGVPLHHSHPQGQMLEDETGEPRCSGDRHT